MSQSQLAMAGNALGNLSSRVLELVSTDPPFWHQRPPVQLAGLARHPRRRHRARHPSLLQPRAQQ